MPDQPSDQGRKTSLASRLLREPLVHFFVLGALIFAAYAWFGPQNSQLASERERIVVTLGRVEQLVQVFQKTWQRPPTHAELKGLIDAYVKEEVYYREAVKRGLDRDDAVIRRRMQQKMQFLSEPSDDALQPSDAQLKAHLEANRADFRVAPKLAFEQVFIRGEPRGDAAEARARKLLNRLRKAESGVHPAALGDHTLLNPSYPLTTVNGIARHFGPEFAEELTRLPRGEWTGPVRSPFGLHVVRIDAYEPAHEPQLSQVRDAVLRQWRTEKREAHLEAEYERLRGQYEVVLSDGIGTIRQKLSRK